MSRQRRKGRKRAENVPGTIIAPTSPAPRFPSLAPSQCPRHSPVSFIGGSVEKDEGIFFVGGGAAREVTPHPARDGW